MHSQSILLSTVGSSPQVVTETLYAIAEQKLSWPTELRIITTSLGAEKVRQGLIVGKQLERLCHELSLPIPKFGEEQLLVVTNEQGQYVEDARSLADHEALANFIMHQVQQITDNENCILHASLAGGRKTMTFYLGYVMSLFGRQQDTLSHVLVSEGYEGKPNFWYPTKNPDYRQIKDYSGNVIAGLDASQAQVTLANIPFIRHRHNLPKLLLKEKTKITFNQLVQLINLGENPEDIELIINIKKRTIVVADKNKQLNCQQEFKPNFIEFAFYLMLVNGTQKGDSTLYRPAKERADLTLLELFLDTVLSLTNIEPGQSYQESLERLKD
ncbi:CRISPR-associated ring nuclease Csm6 [Pseudomonas sp. F1_0610]|uniref:CRISPR-associated ring nuclease Csm6 n=1 Tax=Pseudomonas sp. F1_0610 TaxID=3114284 RepID=UPI0039C2B2AC